MTVRIGLASQDENGKATGGVGGDQNGREVLIRDWYCKPWNVLLRPATAALAEKSAAAMEAACGNANIGYDQSGRNTLYAKAKAADFDLGAIDTPCECDCSSLVHVCAVAGGADIPYGANGCTTRTMVSAFVNSGDYIKLTGKDFLTASSLLQRGDILVKEGSHTAMVLTNGADAAAAAPRPDAVCPRMHLIVLQKGAAGDPVRAMQVLLAAHGFSASRFGRFDDPTEAALREFQQAFNLACDGICGDATWSALLGLTGVG